MQILSNLKEAWELFPYGLAAGMLMASACSFVGVFVVLKRLVFIGATLLQASTCGIAVAFFYHLNPFLGALAATLVTVTLLALPSGERRIPKDAVMAAIFVLAASLAVLFVAKSAEGLEEVEAILYGDLAITSLVDLKVLAAALLPAVLAVLVFFRPVTYSFLDREDAKVLGMRVQFWELLFFYASAVIISASSKIGGMSLVFCFLVVPPAAALLMSGRLVPVFVLAQVLALISVLLGFALSFQEDLPVNPAICVACIGLAAAFVAGKKIFCALKPRRKIS